MPGTRTKRGMYAGSRRGRNRELEESESTTPPRETEGSRRGQPGRPKGSKNKPKGLVPAELTEKMLPTLQRQLSPESFDYIEGVIKRGKPIQTKRELDVMIAMLARNLIAAITHETTDLETKGFRRDITERLKILNSMLTLRHQIDKTQDDGNKPGHDILIKLGSRLDPERVGLLVGIQPGDLAGAANGAGRTTVQVGAVSGEVSERPLLGTGGEQVEADRVLDDHSGGSPAQGSDDIELQG